MKRKRPPGFMARAAIAEALMDKAMTETMRELARSRASTGTDGGESRDPAEARTGETTAGATTEDPMMHAIIRTGDTTAMCGAAVKRGHYITRMPLGSAYGPTQDPDSGMD